MTRRGCLLRAVLLVLALLVTCTADARPAEAHGGGFGPPPNPQAKGPPRGGGPPAFVDPGFGGPIVRPSSTGDVTPRNPGSKRRTPITPTFETSWRLWWALNRDLLIPARAGSLAPVLTPSGAGAAGEGPPAPTMDPAVWEAKRRDLAAKEVVPALVRLLAAESKAPADVKASALLALGKLTTVPEHIEILFAHLTDSRQPDLVRESAALGLGLLRRSSAANRFSSRHLDPVRGRLLQVFDQYLGGKKTTVPMRIRSFAAFAIGLLGDQPFRDDALHKDGRLIIKLLWERLQVNYRDREMHIALLTALGLQPGAGTPDGVLLGLKGILAGEKVLGHQWDELKRAHAVTALARLGGSKGHAALLRLANDTGKPLLLRMAASISLADRARALRAAERAAASRVVVRSFTLEQELLGVGLSNVALGQMVGAQLGEGGGGSASQADALQALLDRTKNAPWYLRGFAALSLGLAAGQAPQAGEPGAGFRRGSGTLLQSLSREGKTQWTVRGAAVVALGLLGEADAVPVLLALLRRSEEDPELRAHAALSLGLLRAARPDVIEALEAVALGGKDPVLRSEAALALSLLGAKSIASQLLVQLEERGGGQASTRALSGVALALGRLGDLGAVAPLLRLARNRDAQELPRAMALVALGRLLDPEPRPSLMRLTRGVCYPARSRALQEVFTIL